MKKKTFGIAVVKCKMLALACFYIVAGFVFSKEVTTFDKAGLSVVGTQGGDTLNLNGKDDPIEQKRG